MKRTKLCWIAMLALALTAPVSADPTSKESKEAKQVEPSTMLVAEPVAATLSDDQAANEFIEQQMVVITDLCAQLGKKGLVVNQKELTQAVATFVTTKLAADKQSLTDGKNSIATVLNDHVDEFMKEFGLPKTQKKQFKAVLAQVFGTHVQVQHKKSGLAIRGPRWSLLLILGLLITILVCLVEPTSAACAGWAPGNAPCHSDNHPSNSANFNRQGHDSYGYEIKPTPPPQPTYYSSSSGPSASGSQAYNQGSNWVRTEFNRPPVYPNIFPKH